MWPCLERECLCRYNPMKIRLWEWASPNMIAVLTKPYKFGQMDMHRRKTLKTAMFWWRRTLEWWSFKPKNTWGFLANTNSQKRQGRTLSSSFQKKHGPTDAVISGFWPPELWDNTFLLFYVTWFVVLCHNSPSKLILLAFTSLCQIPFFFFSCLN